MTAWLFNVASWGYDLLTRQDVWREQISRVLEHVEDESAVKSVLDLGCGPGVSAFELAEQLPHAEVLGIDFARKMIKRANLHHSNIFRHLKNVRFEVADATSLDLDDDSVDLAVGHSFLYLVPDQLAVLREVRRVMAPGGVVVMMEPNREGRFFDASGRRFGIDEDFPAWDRARFVTSMILWRAVSGNVGRLQPDTVREWFLEAGFDEAEIVPTLGGLGMHCIGRVSARS